MQDMTLGAVETRFAELIWSHEPIPSGELVRLCQRELNWKKPTTYNVLRKLCEKGIFRNEGSIVTSRVPREEFYARRSERFVEETYGGSLPAFVAAFSSLKKLTGEELDELERLIGELRK